MVDEKINTDVALPGAASPPPAAEPDKNRSGTVAAPSNELSLLKQDLEQLKQHFAEYAQRDLPEIDRVKQQLQAAASQRDSAAAELKELKRQNLLSKAAAKHGFNDVDYLDFILQKNQIEVEDPQQLAGFLDEFRKSNPRYFSLPLKPGSGSRPGNSSNAAGMAEYGNGRFDAVQQMLAGAPELY
ncbi:MAG: hypothetical protein E7056_00325 [Lentisphaerae bacterium]|nr:hypothetical protein [Lentisphaerota bacterium]